MLMNDLLCCLKLCNRRIWIIAWIQNGEIFGVQRSNRNSRLDKKYNNNKIAGRDNCYKKAVQESYNYWALQMHAPTCRIQIGLVLVRTYLSPKT